MRTNEVRDTVVQRANNRNAQEGVALAMIYIGDRIADGIQELADAVEAGLTYIGDSIEKASS